MCTRWYVGDNRKHSQSHRLSIVSQRASVNRLVVGVHEVCQQTNHTSEKFIPLLMDPFEKKVVSRSVTSQVCADLAQTLLFSCIKLHWRATSGQLGEHMWSSGGRRSLLAGS